MVMIHSAYGIFHLARPAGSRPPASSASYQVFSTITDLAVLPLYTYGCLSVRSSSDHWGTLLQNQTLMDFFVPSLYYALLGGAVLHLLSLCIGLWLALKFKQIARLPPDMNPLEDNLTSRNQKKLSIATTNTFLTARDYYLNTPLEDRHRSGLPYEDIDRPPSVPFHSTRSSPRNSIGSAELPPRQQEISPSNSSRNSVTAFQAPPSTSTSSIPPTPPPRSPWRNSRQSYAEVPTQDLADFRPPHSRGSGQAPASPRGSGHQSRPSTATTAVQQEVIEGKPTIASQPRPAKFTEAWFTTESLFGRTHDRNRAMKHKSEALAHTYEAIRRRYDLSDSESEYENETATAYSVMSPVNDEIDRDDGDLASQQHHNLPNPLRANPSLPSMAGTNSSIGKPKPRMRPNTPFAHKGPLTEIDLNDRRVSGASLGNSKDGADIADEKASLISKKSSKRSLSKRYTWAPRDRMSSIQPDKDFYAKPYGELRDGTPPVLVGSDRQVSSGNDYDMGGAGGAQTAKRYFSSGKRNVSGKVAEEGRGSPGIGWAR